MRNTSGELRPAGFVPVEVARHVVQLLPRAEDFGISPEQQTAIRRLVTHTDMRPVYEWLAKLKGQITREPGYVKTHSGWVDSGEIVGPATHAGEWVRAAWWALTDLRGTAARVSEAQNRLKEVCIHADKLVEALEQLQDASCLPSAAQDHLIGAVGGVESGLFDACFLVPGERIEPLEVRTVELVRRIAELARASEPSLVLGEHVQRAVGRQAHKQTSWVRAFDDSLTSFGFGRPHGYYARVAETARVVFPGASEKIDADWARKTLSNK